MSGCIACGKPECECTYFEKIIDHELWMHREHKVVAVYYFKRDKDVSKMKRTLQFSFHDFDDPNVSYEGKEHDFHGTHFVANLDCISSEKIIFPDEFVKIGDI